MGKIRKAQAYLKAESWQRLPSQMPKYNLLTPDVIGRNESGFDLLRTRVLAREL
jgi:hypothetical protein